MRIRVNYERPFEIAYLGHLDLMRAIERGLRRTGLPLSFSEGFNKRVKIEMGFPLSVGMVGEDEYFDFYLEGFHDIDAVNEALLSAFEKVIREKRLREMQEKAKSLTAYDAVLVHIIQGKPELEESRLSIAEKVERIFDAKSLVVLRDGEEKEVRRFIERVFLLATGGELCEILLSTYYTRMGSIKMAEFLEILGQFDVHIDVQLIKRISTLVFERGSLVSPFDAG